MNNFNRDIISAEGRKGKKGNSKKEHMKSNIAGFLYTRPGIIRYEILHLTMSRTYYYMFLTGILFSIYILSNLTINGFQGTAPFSKWTFSMFLSLIAPFLSMTPILLSGSMFSYSEKTVQKLIFSTPVSGYEYYMSKSISLVVASTAVFVLPLIICFTFYVTYFDFYSFTQMFMPILLFYVPPFVFVIGIAMFSGRIKSKLPYLLLPFFVSLGFFNLKLPVWFDIFGNNFLSVYPFVLKSQYGGTLPYIIPDNFILSRFVMVAIGFIMLVFACRTSKNSDLQ